MRKGETVREYHGRIKKLIESAKASLKEKFDNEAQVNNMGLMLNGIQL